eukprot:scaffold126661_cov28-Tisochrysis_lutea.AAC.13
MHRPYWARMFARRAPQSVMVGAQERVEGGIEREQKKDGQALRRLEVIFELKARIGGKLEPWKLLKAQRRVLTARKAKDKADCGLDVHQQPARVLNHLRGLTMVRVGAQRQRRLEQLARVPRYELWRLSTLV